RSPRSRTGASSIAITRPSHTAATPTWSVANCHQAPQPPWALLRLGRHTPFLSPSLANPVAYIHADALDIFGRQEPPVHHAVSRLFQGVQKCLGLAHLHKNVYEHWPIGDNNWRQMAEIAVHQFSAATRAVVAELGIFLHT